ncbi:hypothetical protein DFH06DRAFT_1298034 [Mycena polygramma]|nr:hypothetical protein DFH06DRAFT_1298034 [Mycena polygramma]
MALESSSVADSVKVLLAGLRSPLDHETGCLFAMFRACCVMGCASAKPSAELIRAMEFLLTARTTEAHGALKDRLTSCSCGRFNHGGSLSATLQPLECLDLFLDHLCGIITEGLRGLRPAKFRTRKPKRGARRQPWPNDTLLRWISPPPVGSEILTLLSRLAQFWNPIGAEIFSSPDVVQHMRLTLIAAARLYEFPVPPQRVDFFRHSIAACYTLAKGLIYVDAKFHSNHPYWNDGLHDLAAVLIPGLAQRGPCLEQELKWFYTMLLQRGSFTLGPGNNIATDDYFQARYEMMMGALRRECMHLRCPVTLGTAVVTTLCSQCGVVSYCTVKCQKYAWNADLHPHKELCTMIARVRSRLGLGRPSRRAAAKDALVLKDHKGADRIADEAWRKWLSRTRPLDTQTVFREKGISPRSCRAIWLHFLLLQRGKGTIPKCWEASWRARSPMVPHVKFTTAYIEDFGELGTEELTQ